MMAGNPTNWWSMMMNGNNNNNNMHPQSHEHLSSSSSSSSSHFYGASSSLAEPPNQDFPRSISQLLLSSGYSGDEEEKFGISPFHQGNTSEDQYPSSPNFFRVPVADVKPELSQLYGYHHVEASEYQVQGNSWCQQQDMPSPASSCVTTGLNHNIFNFTATNNTSKGESKHQHPDHSSECNGTSSTSGGITKKARVQHSSPQPSLKVRKEKLGDRITGLHQLVSPFGKTDTASVLSEAIGYIRFLQAQIQALSSPYMGNASAGSMGHISQHSKAKDLRSRGLCLVPTSCMANIGSDTGADYWSPALGGGF